MVMYCASCGKAEIDDIKLRKCTACDLVKYCSLECQKNHRPQHQKACKKRAARIRYVKLFRQPDENHLGECPICCLPMPLDIDKCTMNSCCYKRICDGCEYANKKREIELGQHPKCPYCREELPTTEEEADQNMMKRVKASDPDALFYMGRNCIDEGDYEAAFKYWSKAAELGDAEARFSLSIMYQNGDGVEKDLKKEIYHLEEAAISGHATARHDLGFIEEESGRMARAKKHFIIAANLGNHESTKALKDLYADGHVSKEEYAVALRACQAAVDATKSQQRDAAEAAIKEEYYKQQDQEEFNFFRKLVLEQRYT